MGLVWLLSQSFARWVILANLVAWPLAYVVLNRWLQAFPYHIKPDALMFIASGATALTIALLTVGFQALKSARVNPAQSLRDE